MSSTELEIRRPGQLAVPQGARLLGQRVKPILRLGMGFRDEAKKGAPTKTDYFTVRGDERAVAKFASVYGEKPKAVKIMLPAELSLALDISYRSFVGGAEDGDGRPLALGNTNFAPLGYVGGPDVLKVWAKDGSFQEVETAGLDEIGQPLDEIAKDLGIELHATFTFTVPDVLGAGSWCAVTSKGRKSADNLAFKLNEIYAAFGSKTPWAFSREDPPLLVLRGDSALMRFQDKKGDAKWGKTSIYVLDIVIPESIHDMLDRLLSRQAELMPHGPAAAVYGRQAAAGELSGPPATEDGAEALEGEIVDEGPSKTAPPEEEQAFEGEEPATSAKSGKAAAADQSLFSSMEFPSGKYSGKTIAQVAKEDPEYVQWAAANWKQEPLKAALAAYLESQK